MGSGTVLLENLPLANAAAASIVSGAVVFAVLRILVTLVRDARWPALGVTAVNGGVLALAWMPAHFFNEAFLFPDEFVFSAWVTSFIALPVVGLLYQIIILGSYSGRNQLARLEETRRNMAFQLSEARRRAWLRQRHLTHTLHSSVQSRVLAESRLVGSGSGKLSSEEQQRSLGTLGMVLDTIDDDPTATIDALDGINDMVAFWAGMCDISLTVQPDLLSTVDAETAESVLIVASEVITNAIRHGSATSMSIDIHRDSPDAIRIIATNNGREIDPGHRPGLGMSLYEELCAEWQILPGKPVTVVALVAARGNKSHQTMFESGSRRGAS
jgi:signal transduction histidine kinase